MASTDEQIYAAEKGQRISRICPNCSHDIVAKTGTYVYEHEGRRVEITACRHRRHTP